MTPFFSVELLDVEIVFLWKIIFFSTDGYCLFWWKMLFFSAGGCWKWHSNRNYDISHASAKFYHVLIANFRFYIHNALCFLSLAKENKSQSSVENMFHDFNVQRFVSQQWWQWCQSYWKLTSNMQDDVMQHQARIKSAFSYSWIMVKNCVYLFFVLLSMCVRSLFLFNFRLCKTKTLMR